MMYFLNGITAPWIPTINDSENLKLQISIMERIIALLENDLRLKRIIKKVPRYWLLFWGLYENDIKHRIGDIHEFNYLHERITWEMKFELSIEERRVHIRNDLLKMQTTYDNITK